MIRLESVLKTSLQDVLKMSWARLQNVLKTSRRYLEEVNVLKTSWQDVLKMFWRRFCKTSWRHLENVLKMSWRRLEGVWLRQTYRSWSRRLEDAFKTYFEDVWLRRIYLSWSRRLEDVLKTSSEDKDKRGLQDVSKTSSSRRMFAGIVLQTFHCVLKLEWIINFKMLVLRIAFSTNFFSKIKG